MRFNLFNVTALIVFLVGAAFGKATAQERITDADMPQQWQYDQAFSQTLPTSDQWWREFNDPVLDSLICIGIDNNYNVLMAQRRIEMARQSLTQARASYFPSLSLDGGWTRSRSSGMTGPVAGKAAVGSYFDLGVNMNWQIDIFGKIRDSAKGTKAAYNATKAEYDGMMVTISAKIATAYMQLRTLQAEYAVLQSHIASQKRVTDITKDRHEAGLASNLDVQQALTTYYSTVATATSIETSITATINGLAVLLGMYPEQVSQWLGTPAEIPDYHQIVAVGVPMELLRRRPDIVEAEYTLAQYAVQLGVAKKDFLPTIALSGSIGTAAHDISDMFKDQSFTYSIAPSLSWTIFDGLSRKAAAASAKQQMMIGIDNYNLTVLNAVQEVETAMATYVNDIKYVDLISDAADAANEAFTLSLDLYKQGLTAFINVSDAQISLLNYSNQLVLAKGQALSDLITLYEALGGGY